MITIASILTLLSKAEPLLDLFKKHWKLLLQVALVIWVIICTLTHCNPPQISQPAVTERVDTIIIYPDTSKWTALTHSDTKPPTPIRTDLPEPTKPPQADTNQSHAEQLDFYKQVNKSLLEEIRQLKAERVYSNTLETDSFRLRYTIHTKGKLTKQPAFQVQHLFPTYTITKERINEIRVPISYRTIDIGMAVGPDFTLSNRPQVRSAMVSLYLGYSDLSNNSFGVIASTSHLNWSIQLAYKKKFQIGLRNKK